MKDFRKLTEEELQQVGGGLIKIVEAEHLTSGGEKYIRTEYRMYRELEGCLQYIGTTYDLDEAMNYCRNSNISTKVVDTREGASQP